MSRFEYKARDTRGREVQGEIDAGSAGAAADQLFANGMTPLDIQELASAKSGPKKPLFEGKIDTNDMVMFTRQMYTLAKAGVPIIRAISGLSDNIKSPRLKRTLGEITESLESGRGLAESLRAHPDVFPNLYVSIVQVGESSGRLEEAFQQIARHLELDKEMRDRVRAALRYPIMVLASIAIAIAVINIKVIPAFAPIFERLGDQLPLPTRILIGFSEFTVNYWPHVLVLLISAFGGFSWYIKTEQGAFQWGRRKLRLPIVGNIITRATLGRFARSFSMAMRSGVPLIAALTAVSRAVDNSYVGHHLRNMRTGIERGESLTRTAAATGLFTPLVMQMLAVGEETGQVDDMMQEVAEFYEREVDYDLKKLSSYIEPIMITLIGGMVLVLALGVFLPMWNLTQLAAH